MRLLTTFIVTLLFSCLGLSQQATQLKSPSEFFPKEKAKVLIMGTFHFNFPGLDSHKTSDFNKIDVLKEPKKSEVTELVEYIKRFRPNKIVIEAKTDWNERYQAYRNGEYKDKRDERYQIAMRLAHELNLDSIFSVDAPTLESELYDRDSVLTKSLTDKIDWDAKDPYWDWAVEWIEHRDSLMKDMHLLDFIKKMNLREAHHANFGVYLTGAMATEDYDGADKISIWWYNRNLRIFSNILRITAGPEDRILLVIGNGHAAILRQLFEASPQFEFVEFDGLPN